MHALISLFLLLASRKKHLVASVVSFLFCVTTPAHAEFQKLSFPSKHRGAFLPLAIGVDHATTVASSGGRKCVDYKGRKNFPRCYHGHQGTDFLLGGWFVAQHIGVDVRAAASGEVVYAEDGHGDHCLGVPTRRRVACLDNPEMKSNYVVIRQDDGLFAFYLHLRKNSVRVRARDRVECGAWLGEVGSSGYSAAPHLHFELRELIPGAPPTRFTYRALAPLTRVRDPFAENLWQSLKRRVPRFSCKVAAN